MKKQTEHKSEISEADGTGEISASAWRVCLETLEKVAMEPELAHDAESLERIIARLSRANRKRRRKQAAEAISPEEKRGRKEQSRRERYVNQEHDREILQSRAVARVHRGRAEEAESSEAPRELRGRNRNCYCCGEPFREVHFFYNRLCPACAEFNYERRSRSMDLSGRVALVTGGRIKIGYETALKFLRDGARVIVTTRFPRDAARRYAGEGDFAEFKERLEIRGLDLRFAGEVRAFARTLKSELPALDILVNCAAQTIQRPDGFYARELELEARALSELPREIRELTVHASSSSAALPADLAADLPGDMTAVEADRHGQPPDLREDNSWTLKIQQVDAGEMLGALLVNSAAPFLLISELRELFERSAFARRYIVNVCGLDGRFGVANKSPDHPHVNMSKAALNMITRTCADEFVSSGIHMNSVDTGWITFEGSHSGRQRKIAAGLNPPLDEVDGASRIYAPIVDGENGKPAHGLLFRNYAPADW